MTALCRLGLFILLLGGVVSSVAAPLASPLTLTADGIGANLQQNFIAAPGTPATTSNGFIAYRKSFTLATAPAVATMYVFADIRYVLWINGQPVHRGPNRFVVAGPQYDTVGIGSALRAGSNTIAIVVMTNGSNAKMMSHTTGLTMRIDIGGQTVVQTDATWKWSNNTRYRPASARPPNTGCGTAFIRIITGIICCRRNGFAWSTPPTARLPVHNLSGNRQREILP